MIRNPTTLGKPKQVFFSVITNLFWSKRNLGIRQLNSSFKAKYYSIEELSSFDVINDDGFHGLPTV